MSDELFDDEPRRGVSMHAEDSRSVRSSSKRKVNPPRVIGDCLPGDVVVVCVGYPEPTRTELVVTQPRIGFGGALVRRIGGDVETVSNETPIEEVKELR